MSGRTISLVLPQPALFAELFSHEAAAALQSLGDVTFNVGNFVGVHAMGLHHLLHTYDARYIGAIWDAAHEALEGMEPEPALDIIADRLFVVNLKNGFWRLTTEPEVEVAEWKVYWTSGRLGKAHWPRVTTKLASMQYSGPVCLTAEYSDEDSVDRLIREDLHFVEELLQSNLVTG